jgi:glutamyl-Q tRNA(Asp) synthetase
VPDYHHHGLIRDAAGARLAKSKGAPALRDLRADGMTREAVLALVNGAED